MTDHLHVNGAAGADEAASDIASDCTYSYPTYDAEI